MYFFFIVVISQPRHLLFRRRNQLKKRVPDAAMIELCNAEKYEPAHMFNDESKRMEKEHRRKEHIPTTLFGVPLSSIQKSFTAVLKASKIMRKCMPQVFGFKYINGGAIIPYKTAIPLILKLLLIETKNGQGYLRVHNNDEPKDPLRCGIVLFWDQSAGNYAQGDGGHFTDLFLKFIQFYNKECC